MVYLNGCILLNLNLMIVKQKIVSDFLFKENVILGFGILILSYKLF